MDKRLGDGFRLSPRGLKGRLLRKPLHTSPFSVLVRFISIENSHGFQLRIMFCFSLEGTPMQEEPTIRRVKKDDQWLEGRVVRHEADYIGLRDRVY